MRTAGSRSVAMCVKDVTRCRQAIKHLASPVNPWCSRRADDVPCPFVNPSLSFLGSVTHSPQCFWHPCCVPQGKSLALSGSQEEVKGFLCFLGAWLGHHAPRSDSCEGLGEGRTKGEMSLAGRGLTWAVWLFSSARSVSQVALALANCCWSSVRPRRSSRSSQHSSFSVTFMSASVLIYSLGCRWGQGLGQELRRGGKGSLAWEHSPRVQPRTLPGLKQTP